MSTADLAALAIPYVLCSTPTQASKCCTSPQHALSTQMEPQPKRKQSALLAGFVVIELTLTAMKKTCTKHDQTYHAHCNAMV